MSRLEGRKLYVKNGRRYEPVGAEFVGFPCDGLWLVKSGDGSRSSS
jgi:hypothetical protein